ncbi:MAG: cytochrome b5 domain-containing protein [Eubacteriales bacterium]
MQEQKGMIDLFYNIIDDMNSGIEKLYSNPFNRKILNQLKHDILILEQSVSKIIGSYKSQKSPREDEEFQTQKVQNIFNKNNDFSLEELSVFNGQNGNPAYVAVNGIVYDVSDNPVWPAAAHFGLIAGNDLTAEFHSCHTLHNILNKLPAVGRLVSYI